MTATTDFEIFLATAPGLEGVLADEAREQGFAGVRALAGGVAIKGGWPQVWRANLDLRGASRVLARVASFKVLHLAELDRLARRVAWGRVLRRDIPFRVEAVCRKSRIYHSGAAAERVERAIREELGAAASPEAQVAIMARIEGDVCTLSVDTSGELLHKRGFKEAVAKAPMRETLAALFLRLCAFDGREPVLDPMCGSGTFVIEAAEMAAGLKPGRARSFAFEQLATFDAAAWEGMRSAHSPTRSPGEEQEGANALGIRYHGSDRDAGAVAMSRANAERAGVGQLAAFRQLHVAEIAPPDGPPGLVIVNAPYGGRIGDRARIAPVYRTLGQVLMRHFAGWRVGLVTTSDDLARATGLPFGEPSAPVDHGGIKIRLYRTAPLK